MLISRSGYTGKLGYELHAPAEEAAVLWEYLERKGKAFGLSSASAAKSCSTRSVPSMPIRQIRGSSKVHFSFPVFGVPGFKFGKYHHFEEQGRPEQIKRKPSREDEEMLREFTARYFPHATGPTLTLKECMFTNAPDGHFIVDLHPEFP